MKKNRIIIAILIALLAFGLREYLAYYGSIEADEPTYFNAANIYNLAMRGGNWDQITYSTFNYEHPEFYKLIYSLGLMFGKPVLDSRSFGFQRQILPIQIASFWHKVLILRTISVFFGTATVFLLSLIDPIAGLFLAVSTYAIKYTSVIYLDALPALTSFIALITALKALQEYQLRDRRPKKYIFWLIISSLSLGMTAASKYMYAVVGLAIAIAIFVEGWKQKRSIWKGIFFWGILSLAFFYLFDPALWRAPLAELTKSLRFSVNYTAGYDVLTAGYPFWQPLKWLLIGIPSQSNQPWAFNVTSHDFFLSIEPIVFVLAVIGLPELFKENKPMFIWLVVGIAFLLIWQTKWPQYILTVLAPYCISASNGVKTIAFLARKTSLHQTWAVQK